MIRLAIWFLKITKITYVGNKSSYSNRSILSQIYPEIKSKNTEKNVNIWNDNLSIVAGKSDENVNDQSSKTSTNLRRLRLKINYGQAIKMMN